MKQLITTYEDPPFSDLKNIWIEIYEISIHEENKITFLSSLEINNIEKQIKKLI
jgi:hypothetical protein